MNGSNLGVISGVLSFVCQFRCNCHCEIVKVESGSDPTDNQLAQSPATTLFRSVVRMDASGEFAVSLALLLFAGPTVKLGQPSIGPGIGGIDLDGFQGGIDGLVGLVELAQQS